MKNIISKKIPALLAMAGEASTGAATHGATLPLLQNTQAAIDTDINALKAKVNGHAAAKGELKNLRVALDELNKECRIFATAARDSFKPTLGFTYSSLWEQAGCRINLQLPRAPRDVKVVLETIKDFLASTPSMEVPSKEITATRAGDLATQLQTAIAAVNEQETVTDTLKGERDQKATVLFKRLSGLIAELKMRMDGLDPRWLAFGLNKPGAIATPDQVEGVHATLVAPGTAAMKWNAAARADYYHVFKKVLGVDSDYVLVGSPADLDFTIDGLPAGATIDIVVSAVNSGGESVVSDKVTLTTHA